MIDDNLGNLSLVADQISRFGTLHDSNIKGFSQLTDGTTVVHSDVALTAGERTQVISDLQGLATTSTAPAKGSDVETRYATKSTDADRIIFLKDAIKLMTDGDATVANIGAL